MEVKVHQVNSGSSALQLALKLKPDGIIMDIQLKETDGIELCRMIKSRKEIANAFVLFYTKQSEEYVQIAGLNAGADDYIIRPVRQRILQSRIRALSKRRLVSKLEEVEPIISHGNVSINREQYKVLMDDNLILLPRKEFELLYLLAEKPGKVFSRRELSNQIWGENDVVKGRTIDVHIRKIREKLGNQSIKTIKGIGYKWKDAD